jgi:hypothetical protein
VDKLADIKDCLDVIQKELVRYLQIIYKINVKINKENKLLKDQIKSLKRNRQVKARK